jgi:hypothetical protein
MQGETSVGGVVFAQNKKIRPKPVSIADWDRKNPQSEIRDPQFS